MKKGLLVVSFGTTHEETRRKTIDGIERHLAGAFPERKLYRGWTSRMIVKRLKEKSGLSVDSLEEAMKRMAEEGIEDLLVQPTHIMAGWENDRMLDVLRETSDAFSLIRIGQPLLAAEEDLRVLARLLKAEFPPQESRALLLMGHGTDKKREANEIYLKMEEMLQAEGYEDAYVATVEGQPDLDDVLQRLRNRSVKSVLLSPLMIVAGDHASNDMAGDDEDSWKNRIEAEGMKAIPILRGLGEYEGVRMLLEEHAREAELLR